MRCSCTDVSCPYNPVNHDRGCSPCIAKNLRCGEIPSCFFVEVQGTDECDGYSYQHFARVVMENLGVAGTGSKRTFRQAEVSDLEAIARLYTHHWCNYVTDPEDKMLAARHCVLAQLVRSPLTIVACDDDVLVGVCMGCVMEGGHAPQDERWLPAFEEVHALAVERAKTAYPALEGQLFGDLRELETADAFIATGDPFAQAELNLFMVEPWLKGTGLGGELLSRMRAMLREAGAERFFLMTDTASNYAYYERRGMRRVWARYEDPDDPNSWGALMYGGDL